MHKYPTMSLCQVHWFSQIIGKTVGAYVILPDVGKPPFATFYLLHGLSDDYTIWLRRTRIEWYVRKLPLIVVMPDGFRGFYTNHAKGPAYATYIGEELPAFIERNFPALPERSFRCIGGLSMGGYGALRVALAYPDRFASANSHSGCLAIANLKNEHLPAYEWLPMFGPRPAGTKHDLVYLAKLALKSPPLPQLRIDCGRGDFLIQHNRFYHRQLQKLRIAHEYEEFPGEHTWDYWDKHVRKALRFHARGLGLKEVE